jgi:hypothetical protein
MKFDQHILKIEDKWAVIGEGNSRVTSLHDSEIDAIITANRITNILGSSLYIHRDKEKSSFRKKQFI